MTYSHLGDNFVNAKGFGVKYLDMLKPFFKEVKKLAESTNAEFRKEAITFY